MEYGMFFKRRVHCLSYECVREKPIVNMEGGEMTRCSQG